MMAIYTRSQGDQVIDPCSTATPTRKHLEGLRKNLTQEQLKKFEEVCQQEKTKYYAAIETWNYQQLKQFRKRPDLEKLCNQLHQQHPELPCDLFMNKLHYAFNGAQSRVEQKLKRMEREKDAARAVKEQPVGQTGCDQKAAATAVEEPVANDESDRQPDADSGDNLTNTSDAESDTSAEGDSLDDSNDKTIIESTQSYAESPTSPLTHPTPPASATTSTSPRSYVNCGTQTEHHCSKNEECIPGCKFVGSKNVKGANDWLRCIICMRWCHAECCKEAAKYEGAFTCPSCRRIPDDVSLMKAEISEIRQLLRQLISSKPSDQPRPSDAEIQAGPSQEVVHSSVDSDDDVPNSTPPPNQELWMKTRKQKRATKRAQKKKQKPRKNKKATKVTIVADSVLRNISISETEKLCSDSNCQIKVIEEPTIDDVTRLIKSDAVPHQDPIVIHVGTNNIASEGLRAVTDRLEKMEYNLERRGYKRVAISSVVYRRASRHIRQKIWAINNHLYSMCIRQRWTFIDNDNVDESCLIHNDSVHPNRYGTEQLSNNISAGIRKLVPELE
jgi:hypothetical protein